MNEIILYVSLLFLRKICVHSVYRDYEGRTAVVFHAYQMESINGTCPEVFIVKLGMESAN